MVNAGIMMVLPLVIEAEGILPRYHGIFEDFFMAFIVLLMPSYYCARNMIMELVPPEAFRNHPSSQTIGTFLYVLELGGLLRRGVFAVILDLGYLALFCIEIWLVVRWWLQECNCVYGKSAVYAIVGGIVVLVLFAMWRAYRAIEYGNRYRAILGEKDQVNSKN